MKKKLLLIGLSAIALAACGNSESTKESSTSSSVSESSVSSAKESSASSSVANDSSDDFVATASQAVFADNMLKGNSYSVRITDYKIIKPGEQGNEYSDKPIIVFFYDTLVAPNYDNSAPISPMIAWTFNFKAVQDNDPNKVNTLEYATYSDDELSKNNSAEIRPGGTVKSAEAYKLSDDSTPVKLIAETIGKTLGEQTYQVK